MEVLVYLDTILVPLSLFLLIGYHAYLWQTFKTKPSHTTIGIDSMRRRIWFLEIKEGDGLKDMLAVQRLRNTQMVAIFTASTAIAFSLALAALTNNAYNASHLLIESPLFGSQSGRMFALKYGFASVILLFSSLCSSMATVFLIDTIFLINASAEFSSSGITQTLFERGYMLALIGNRLLWISFPLMLWCLVQCLWHCRPWPWFGGSMSLIFLLTKSTKAIGKVSVEEQVSNVDACMLYN